MNCPDVRDLIYPFLDGELDVDRNVRVLKHLEMCPACHQRSEDARGLGDLVQRVAPEPADELLCARLFAALDGPPPAARWAWAPRLLAAAAALLLAVWWVREDPYCWLGCSTAEVLHSARLSFVHDPLTLSDVEQASRSAVPAPQSPTLDCLGGNCLGEAGREADWEDDPTSPRAVVRYRCKLSGREFCYVEIPQGHVHLDPRRGPDGREYVLVQHGELSAVGWFDAGGRLCFAVPRTSLADADLFAMGQAVRDARAGGVK